MPSERVQRQIDQLLDEIVIPLYEIRNRRPGYKCSMIKAGMDLAGLKGGSVRAPLIELSPPDRQDLQELLLKTAALSPRGVPVGTK